MPKKQEPRKPIITNDPNDLRLTAYKDSLDSYNWTKNIINKINKTGRSPKGDKIDVNKKELLSPEDVIREKLEVAKRFNIPFTKKEALDDMYRLDPINKGTKKLNKAIGYASFPFVNSKGTAKEAIYAKPVQPYIYQEDPKKVEEAKKLKAYKDSLTMHNFIKPIKDFVDNAKEIRPGVIDKNKYNKIAELDKDGFPPNVDSAYVALTKLNGKEPDSGKWTKVRVGDKNSKNDYTTGFFPYRKPIELVKKEIKPIEESNIKKDNINSNNGYKTQIETTPNYRVKYTKDNTGKVINEEYFDFNDKPIKKMKYGGTFGDDIDQKTSKNVSNKRLTSKQWDEQNTSLGYQPTGFGNNSYKEYYNPNEYFKDEKGGFMKIADRGKIVDYTNDNTYKPTIKYFEQGIPDLSLKKQAVKVIDPMKQVGFNGMLQPIIEQRMKNGGIMKYKNGGFGQKALNFGGNWLKATGDIALSTVGMGNVIDQDDYKGNSAEDFKKISNIGGKVTQSIVPIAAGAAGMAIGGPQGAQIGYAGAKGLQTIGGNFNPADSQGGSYAQTDSMETGNNAYNTINGLGQFGMSAMNSGMFANGGMNTNQNAEVELEENSISPNGEFTQYNGPSHKQGGVKTNLEPNEIVFSDRLKPKGSKKTFADLNKLYNTNKEDKLIDDKKSNNLKRITAQLMKEAKMKQSMSLFQQQEELKQSKLSNYAKRLGVNNDKFAGGGVKDDPIYGPQQLPHGIMGAGYNPNAYEEAMKNVGITRHWDQNGTISSNNTNNNYESQDPLTNPSQTGNFNWQGIASQIGQGLVQNAGNLYDLKRSQNVDKESYNRVSPETLDPSQALKYNSMQGRMAADNIRNASGGNASTYLQNRKDLAINQMNSNANIRMNYQNQNAGIQNQAKYYNAGVGDRETIANLQNQAQARNIKSNAISSIGENIMGQSRDNKATKINQDTNNQMAQRDQDYLKIIAARYPEILKDPQLAGLYR